jgi:hypothetical protein
MNRARKMMGWSLLLAIVLGGVQQVKAQDQNPAPTATAEKGGKKHHDMEACKDDVAQLCADAKGHKEVGECLKKNEDKLSKGCSKARAKMEKRWKKDHKDKGDDAKAPAAAPSTTP